MGNPFVHLDLATDDVGKAKKFYKSVFDWEFQDFPEMKWTGINVGQGVGGGMGGKQTPNEPTAWTAYVGVDDVKVTMAKAKKAGATVVVPFLQVGEAGFLGVFVDPQGATVGVWAQASKAPPPAKKKAAAAPPKKAAASTVKKAAAPTKEKAAAPAKKAAAKASTPAKKAAKATKR